MTNQRRIGIVLSYTSTGIRVLTALLYTPIMLRLLGESEYGLYQLVHSVVGYMSLMSLGLEGAYIRFYSRFRAAEDEEGVARLNGLFIVLFTAMAILCLAGGWAIAENAQWVFGDKLTPAEQEMGRKLALVMSAALALTFPSNVFQCQITAHERFCFSQLLNVLQNLLNPILTIPLLLLGYGSLGVALVVLALAAVRLAACARFCFTKLRVSFRLRGIPFDLLKEIVGFTFFIFLGQIIDQVNWSVDKLLLGRLVGTAGVAVYGLAGQIHQLYMQFAMTVSTVFVPKVHALVQEGQKNAELTRLFAKVGRVQCMVLLLLVTGFTFFGRPFILLWSGPQYEQAYPVVLLLFVSAIVPLIQNLGLEIQRAMNRHRVRSIVYFFGALANIAISIPLIKRCGAVGAALGTAVVMILANGVFMNWYYARHMGLDMGYFWRQIGRLLPPLLPCLILGAAAMALLPLNSIASLASAIVGYTALYCLCLWKWGLNSEERRMLKRRNQP